MSQLLAKRRLEILELAAQGKTTPEIAKMLFIAEETVKTHKKNILLQLNAKNMSHAVAKAIRTGVIE